MDFEDSSYRNKALTLFLAIFFPIFLILTIFTSWKLGLLFGLLAGLFTSFQLARNLTRESFEINATNKDKTKGLKWYEDEIIAMMNDLRYQLIEDKNNVKVWQPRLRARVMGGEFKMEVTPYSITITGPRGMVRIVKSVLDLTKIFL